MKSTKTRKKLKLKKGVKRNLLKLSRIIITILFVILDIYIYHLLGVYGYKAQESNFFCNIICMGWAWLFFGWFFIALLWEN